MRTQTAWDTAKFFGRMVEDPTRLLDIDNLEPLHELSYLDSILQVFKQSRNRNAGAAKHPGAPQAPRVTLNHAGPTGRGEIDNGDA